MLKKVLFILSFLTIIILIPNNKIYADSDMDNYSWTKLTDYFTGRDIYAVAYNGTNFVAVGQKGLILRSQDGIDWDREYSGYEEDFCKIEWDGSNFTAVTRSGRKLVSSIENKWSLVSEKSEPITENVVNIENLKPITSCKIYGFAQNNKMAVAVGQSGNIFYGTEKGQIPLKLKEISFYDGYGDYREYLKRIGNATILNIGSSILYTDNNLVNNQMPVPFIKNINNKMIAYVPADYAVKAIGGQFNYDKKSGIGDIEYNGKSLEFTQGSVSVRVNDKKINFSSPVVIEKDKIFVPIGMFNLLGKKIFSYGDLIIISSVEEIFDIDYDEMILQSMVEIFSEIKDQHQSLSESIVNSLVKISARKLEEEDFTEGESYLQKAAEVEPASEIYTALLKIKHLTQQYDEDEYYQSVLYGQASKYFKSGLFYSSENADLYAEMMYIYCNICWYEKAEECINKAISLSSKASAYKSQLAYLEKSKGKKENLKEITVSNYKELVKAIGSNRIIKVLPGNYSYKNAANDISGVSHVNNLTIEGVLEKGKDKLDLKDASIPFSFTNCGNITINNLELKNSFKAINCSNLAVNNSKVYHGAQLRNVYNLSFTNSYIEGIGEDGKYEDSIVEIHSSEQINFEGCTMKGYTLRIGDDYDEALSSITITNCNLINNAGICSIWSNYVPIKDESGYENFLGTEGWNEWRFLAAVKYVKKDGYVLSYENTYDGNEEIFNDGKFNKLAEKLSALTNNSAFPSIDYIVGDTEDYNAYYDFYGTPEAKKLNINFNIKDPSSANLNQMFELINQLKPLEQDIIAYNWPISIVLRDEKNPFIIYSVADFSNKSFKEFLEADNESDLGKYCTVLKPFSTDASAANFYCIEAKNTEDEVIKEISNLFLTRTVKTLEGFGQENRILFTLKNKEGYFYITALESFDSMGDFMHYSTDMIIKTNAITGEKYIATKDKTYRLESSNEINNAQEYKKIIFEELNKDKTKKLFAGTPCDDVLAFIKNDDNDKELKFVFLTCIKNKDYDSGYEDLQYFFQYYTGTLDLESNKITRIENINLVDYDEMLFK